MYRNLYVLRRNYFARSLGTGHPHLGPGALLVVKESAHREIEVGTSSRYALLRPRLDIYHTFFSLENVQLLYEKKKKRVKWKRSSEGFSSEIYKTVQESSYTDFDETLMTCPEWLLRRKEVVPEKFWKRIASEWYPHVVSFSVILCNNFSKVPLRDVKLINLYNAIFKEDITNVNYG